jgi:hypothetical protein
MKKTMSLQAARVWEWRKKKEHHEFAGCKGVGVA